MGARLNWLAVKGADEAALLARLGLVESGTASDEFSSALACAVFPGGWLVLVSAGMEPDLDEALPLTSTDGLSLGCEIARHVQPPARLPRRREATGLELRRRIAALFRSRAGVAGREMTSPAPIDPFDKLIARIQGDLAARET